ncbi:MAG TPA: DUF4870 domain-containing protein [Bacteroidetes bacterium]|nr:DUF4870 domain-containing protein [Bacteroidota bacterium]
MSDLSSPILDYSADEEFDPTQDEKTMALLSHVLTLVVGFIAPLVIYLVKKDESEFVKAHAIESLNFQISLFIYFMGCFALMLVIIGFFMAIALGVAALVLTIVATIKASEGKMYRYPFIIRLIK